MSVLVTVEAEVFQFFAFVFAEFGALRRVHWFVFFSAVFGDFEDSVFGVLELFGVGDWLSVGVGVVVVGSVLVLVCFAAAVDGVFEDVFEFLCFAVFDGEDGFSVFFVGSAEVLEYFGGFGECGVFCFEV